MKNIVLLIALSAIIIACKGPGQISQISLLNDVAEVADTVEYELIIIDPGFDSWFISHAKPVWFYSQSYLESWNRQYVTAWNSKTMSGRQNRFFETYIDYLPHIDYGLELNYKLFYYFQYVERKLRVPVLPQGIRPQNL